MDQKTKDFITNFNIEDHYRKDCKPCPFCGKRAVILVGDDEETFCECNNCGASTCGFENEADAIAQWNWRNGQKLVNPVKESDYDEVYYEGLEWLNTL